MRERPEAPGGVVTGEPVRLDNNVQGVGERVQGRDWEQWVESTPGALLDGPVFRWDHGEGADWSIRAFPSVMVGWWTWGAEGVPLADVPIGGLCAFEVVADVERTGGPGSNLAFDLWLTDRPEGAREAITTEVMVWIESGEFPPAGEAVGRIEVPGLSGTAFHAAGHGEGGWTHLALVPDERPAEGRVDLLAVPDGFEALGLVDAGDYAQGFELGAEVLRGSGSLLVRGLTWEVRACGGGEASTLSVPPPAVEAAALGLG